MNEKCEEFKLVHYIMNEIITELINKITSKYLQQLIVLTHHIYNSMVMR